MILRIVSLKADLVECPRRLLGLANRHAAHVEQAAVTVFPHWQLPTPARREYVASHGAQQ
jgi:hypothetical protein